MTNFNGPLKAVDCHTHSDRYDMLVGEFGAGPKHWASSGHLRRCSDADTDKRSESYVARHVMNNLIPFGILVFILLIYIVSIKTYISILVISILLSLSLSACSTGRITSRRTRITRRHALAVHVETAIRWIFSNIVTRMRSAILPTPACIILTA